MDRPSLRCSSVMGCLLPVPDDLRSDACSRFRAAQRLDERQPEGKGTSAARPVKISVAHDARILHDGPRISGSMPG